MDTVPPVIEPMQVDFEADIENGDENIVELNPIDQRWPPANEDHPDFQVQGPTNLDLETFLNLYQGWYRKNKCVHVIYMQFPKYFTCTQLSYYTPPPYKRSGDKLVRRTIFEPN